MTEMREALEPGWMVGREARRGRHRHPNTINRRLGVAMSLCTDVCVHCAGFIWFFWWWWCFVCFFTVLFSCCLCLDLLKFLLLIN